MLKRKTSPDALLEFNRFYTIHSPRLVHSDYLKLVTNIPQKELQILHSQMLTSTSQTLYSLALANHEQQSNTMKKLK